MPSLIQLFILCCVGAILITAGGILLLWIAAYLYGTGLED